MLKQRTRLQDYHVAPRKLIKLNVMENQDYNEFKGEMCEEAPINNTDNKNQEKQFDVTFSNNEEETNRNKNIFNYIKTATHKSKKIEITAKNNQNKQKQKQDSIQKQEKGSNKHTLIKEEEILKVQHKESLKQTELKPKIKVKPPQPSGSNNWAAFKQQLVTQVKNSTAVPSVKSRTECVALDCEFVKSGDQQCLARLSLVTQGGKCLYDSYVRPSLKITDYLTDISGITYTHIKNAPDQQTVVAQAKKIMYNKIVVGHTIWKDLQVCGLSHWKGYKALIDINDFAQFKQSNGKLISLKNLASRKLGKQIQDGRHSSVEDAETTLALFNLRKRDILKQFKVIL